MLKPLIDRNKPKPDPVPSAPVTQAPPAKAPDDESRRLMGMYRSGARDVRQLELPRLLAKAKAETWAEVAAMLKKLTVESMKQTGREAAAVTRALSALSLVASNRAASAAKLKG